jgi:hypothetical protein
MLVVTFPSDGQRGAQYITVISVEVREHTVVARFPNGKTSIIAEHVGLAGWRLPDTMKERITDRVFPRFTVSAQAG